MRKNELPDGGWSSGITNLRGILRGQSPRSLLSPTSHKDLNTYIQNLALDLKYSISNDHVKDYVKPYKETITSSSPRGSMAMDGSTRMSPREFELKINLQTTFNNHSLKYKYSCNTLMHEIIKYLKDIAGSKHVLFRSGNMMVDYTLTLPDIKVGALSPFQPLNLRVQPIAIDRMAPQNSLKRFHIIRCVGSGGFSRVFLAQVNGVYVALKVIDKDFLVQNEKEIIVENERRILTAFSHPFITRVHYTIETESFIAIALEYCSGGELFYLLKKVKRMKESEARFYFAQVLAALQALHEKNMVYRDLKPQNIILDYEGHIRLADFGLSKIMEDELTHSFCGSAEYMAPEMLERGGHNFSVDYYCIGALLYQLVTGLPPYYSKDQNELFKNILNNTLEFPERYGLSNQIISLLSLLLIKNPQQRLGSRFGISEIWSHPWMMGLTLEDILRKKLHPPFKPSPLQYNFDDSEFKSGQFQQMTLLEREKIQGDLKTPVLTDFYYESEQMRLRRESILKESQGKRTGSPFGQHNFEKKSKTKQIVEPSPRRKQKAQQFKPMRENRQVINLSPRNHNPHDRINKGIRQQNFRRDMPELIRYKSQGNLQHHINLKGKTQFRKSQSSQNLSMRYITNVKREIGQLNLREASRNKLRGYQYNAPGTKSPRISRNRQDLYFMRADNRPSNGALLGINRSLNLSVPKRPVSSGRHQQFNTKRYHSPPKPQFLKSEPPRGELKRGYLNKDKLKNYFMKKY